MKLKLDPDTYMEHQEILIGNIILSIRAELEKAGVTGNTAKEVTKKLAFSIACDLDSTAGIEFDGVEVNPLLMFENLEGEMVHCGGNSSMHELVQGITEAVFGE